MDYRTDTKHIDFNKCGVLGVLQGSKKYIRNELERENENLQRGMQVWINSESLGMNVLNSKHFFQHRKLMLLQRGKKCNENARNNSKYRGNAKR